jgi:hypothetical protein
MRPSAEISFATEKTCDITPSKSSSISMLFKLLESRGGFSMFIVNLKSCALKKAGGCHGQADHVKK